MVKIKLVRSPIGLKPKARLTIRALGLTKVNKTRMIDETNPAVWGMVCRVRSFVEVGKVS